LSAAGESTLLELHCVECRGSPQALGRAHGEALRETIRAFVDQRLRALSQYFGERGQSARVADFDAAGRACLAQAERWDADGTAEHRGIAEAAGIDAATLYATANMTDVRDVLLLPSAADREGCTSLLVPKARTASRELLAAQTWDLNPEDLDFVVAIHRLPDTGPETWSVTCAGALSLVGMNAHGIAVGTTNIKTRASRPGVGYLTILHRAIRSASRSEALAALRGAPRAAAHSYWVADAGGANELETDPEAIFEQELGGESIVQTNHCQTPELARREGEAASSSSQRRLARAKALLSPGNLDLAAIQRLFADRIDGVDSINRRREDEQGTTTNACLVAIPARRELWACRGPADRGRWLRLPFATAG
jgi:isopenicillin-N N-acyltransferase-like protein